MCTAQFLVRVPTQVAW